VEDVVDDDVLTTLYDTFTVTISGLPTTTSTTPTTTATSTTTAAIDVPIEFTSPNYTTYYVCESDQADEEVVALAAKRGDTFDGFSFSIVSPQTKFKINNDTKLVVAGNNSFDAESGETSYNLTLKVVLASDSTKSATVNITIIVDDVNDNYPVFSNLSYSFAILEGSPAGNTIGLVSATDADATAPNNVTFFQINGTAEFKISNKGAITIASNVSLDYAKQSSYSFTVTATDGGTDGSELNSSVNVQVTIETRPKFAYEGVINASISEDIGQQAFVLSISASDSDRSPNPNLMFDLSAAPTVASMFKLNGSNLTTADSTFDFENQTFYPFIVGASDGKYFKYHILQIFVLDVNEPPRFNSSVFTAMVPDNLLGGAIVTTVVATDPDSTAPNNTILSYNINGSSELRISNEGVITLQNGFSLDYRNTPYNLIVTATDGGTNGSALTGTASVIVHIESVPKFSASHVRTALIREDISKQSSVMSLTASDSDAAPNTTLMFDIVSQTPTSPVMFKVIGTTLTTSNETFDYENQTLYSVVVRAYGGKYDSTLSLNISVDDVNDNPPRFNSSVFTKSIVENFTIDGVVVRVAASDNDATPEFANTSYSISAGNENNTFLIDKDTGDIKLQSVPLQQRYNLTVKAQDKNKNSLSSETNLTIIVDGGVVNECVSNPCQNNGTCTSFVNNYLCTCQQGWTGIRCETNVPIEFTSPNYTTYYVCESDQADEEVVALAAKRGDTFDGFSFSIVSPQTKFKINNDKKLVVAGNNSFDAESGETSYNLTLKVVHASDSTKSATVNITIIVDDVNDKYPVFSNLSYSFAILEGSPAGNIIGLVSATDADATAPNNVTSFQINGTAEFIISNRGAITIANNVSLEYAKQSRYSFTVTATDGGTDGSELNSSVNVQVTIETLPKFSASHVRTALIREDISKQSSVMSLTASDRDAAPNPTLMFDIVSQTPTSPVMFKVIGTTLTTSNKTFDFENQTLYSVVVRAYDGKYDSTLSLNISVDDVNDNPPRFNPSVFTKSIVENFTIDGVVVRVAARDDDATPEFAKTSYSISAGNENNTFLIDKDTGDIKLQSVPLQQRYNLMVKAQDKHKNSLSSETNLTIIVDGGVVNECVSNPCQNNGTCTSYVNNYLCTCQQGWTGIRCETNINECEGVVCDNNGTCVDHINSFKCNCSAGWKGTLCKEACTNNTYGRNCAQECQCEPAKLPADVGFPTCDIVTGHCKCSKFWTGAACETDVNECYMVPDPCNIKEKNRVCKNTIPKFDCVCKYGFIETNSTCIEAPKNCGTVNENSKNVTFNLDLTPNCNFSYLSCKEEHLNNANKTCLQLRYADSCEVCDVREGSLVVELNVVVDKNPTKMAQFAQELQSIRDGKEEIVYGDKTYTIQSIYVSTIPLNRTKAGNDTNKHLCEVYAIIAQCNSCEVDKDTNLTYCKEKKQDDLPLLLGLGLGIGLTLILFLMFFVVVVAVILRKKQLPKGDNGPAHRQTPLPVSRRRYKVTSRNAKRGSRDPGEKRVFEKRGKMYDNMKLNGSYSNYGYGQGPLWKESYMNG
ncbi:hypothetical protein DPMN_059838, partial [Dreissena polymorpha]